MHGSVISVTFICIFTRKNSNPIGVIDVIAGIFILFVIFLNKQEMARNAANALEKAPGKQG
jgi:Co/Zn/Cd efflux system component